MQLSSGRPRRGRTIVWIGATPTIEVRAIRPAHLIAQRLRAPAPSEPGRDLGWQASHSIRLSPVEPVMIETPPLPVISKCKPNAAIASIKATISQLSGSRSIDQLISSGMSASRDTTGRAVALDELGDQPECGVAERRHDDDGQPVGDVPRNQGAFHISNSIEIRRQVLAARLGARSSGRDASRWPD